MGITTRHVLNQKRIFIFPNFLFFSTKLDVPSLSQRYTNLYVPSDFFNAQVKWGETFPPQSPLSLNNPCQYHVMSKDVENPYGNDAVLEPPDADYRFSAKVISFKSMLILFLCFNEYLHFIIISY